MPLSKTEARNVAEDFFEAAGALQFAATMLLTTPALTPSLLTILAAKLAEHKVDTAYQRLLAEAAD
jgi:hypothetical protein